MAAQFTKTFSEKGKPMIVRNGFKFRLDKKLRGEIERWRCTNRTCACSFEIFGEQIFDETMHNHEPLPAHILNRNVLSNTVKRRAEDNYDRPAKIARTVAAELQMSADITAADLNNVRKNLQRERIKTRPLLPIFN